MQPKKKRARGRRALIRIISILGVFLALTSVARAESALRALGQAYQDQYTGIKKLGPKATKAQVMAVTTKSFAKANAMVAQEVVKKQVKFIRALDQVHKMAKEELNSARKDYKEAKAKNMTVAQYRKTLANGGKASLRAPGASDHSGGGATSHRPSSSEQNNTTGQVTGSDGAKSVEFGEKQKEQPKYKVIDGIIQDQ